MFLKKCHEPLSQNIDVEQNIPEIVHINNGNRGKDGNQNQNSTENTFSSVLKEIRLKNVDRLIVAHLNINYYFSRWTIFDYRFFYSIL